MTMSAREIESISTDAARWVARRDAGLSPSEQRSLDRWLASDPRHAAAFQHYGRMWSTLDRPRKTGVANEVIQEANLRGKLRRRRRAAAATALMAALLVGGALWLRRTPDTLVPRIATNALILRPETRVLPDGSTAELKPGAVIEIDYRPEVRHVILRKGQAHFRVEKNNERPFKVTAASLEFRAVGTAFAVQLGPTHVELLVTEGKVAVDQAKPISLPIDSAANPAAVPPQTIVSVAGNRLVVPLELSSSPLVPEMMAPTELNERLAWRAPRVEFSGTPLSEAVALMNRASGHDGVTQIHLTIDLSLQPLAEEPVSGVFRADNAVAFVRMLELSLGLQADRYGNEIVLRQRK